MQETIEYMQSQSMRNNLIFSGVEESDSEKPEVTEGKLRAVLVDKMKLARDYVDSLKLERVHRTGDMSASNPGRRTPKYRNIIVKFTFFKDREIVRRASSSLKGTGIFINEQFPKEVAERRRALMPLLRNAREEKKKAWISYDTLYIDGVKVKVPESANVANGASSSSETMSA
ncbi:uncharacterized protein LOC123541337 [Mercenaria mercenaria]|uniref:uncharacterized protein LOC123541337 n=1 Tax=Mercenaria mercenaria TaxID=6596 RepID=UPI00234EDCF3|nr:uncharacterized protein LOC123541337 [Mercenaria mercenaria]